MLYVIEKKVQIWDSLYNISITALSKVSEYIAPYSKGLCGWSCPLVYNLLLFFRYNTSDKV